MGGGGGGGATDFVFEIRYLKDHPNFAKSVLLIRYDLKSEFIQLVTSQKENLIVKQQHLQTLTAACWWDSMLVAWDAHLIFVYFLPFCRGLEKKMINRKK